MSIPKVEADGFRRYNRWGGNPEGTKEDLELCVADVYEDVSRMHYQCHNRRHLGPGGMYCGIHDPTVEGGVLYTVEGDFFGKGPELREIDIIKETERTYVVKGSQYTRYQSRILKQDMTRMGVTTTPESAIEIALERARSDHAQKIIALQQAAEVVATIEKLARMAKQA